MNRSGSYEATSRRRYSEREYDRSSEHGGSNIAAKEGEVVMMNLIAIGLALGAVALFIVGMLVGTGVSSSTDTAIVQWQEGSIWLLGAFSLALTAAIFRREHHIVDPTRSSEREEESEESYR
ncbi:MAG TPA: hypothetical protein VFY79_03460 [Dehalococcoidia bacterium]|nr:hypothetical protein [Dehalococcoidia bacterium]